jgi:hypothetical protein
MAQVTWRAPETLVERVRHAARRAGCSVNEYLTRLAQAATDPTFAGSEADRLRERLAQAGLLADGGEPRRRPDPAALARASSAASRGTPLSDLVARDRA